MNGLQITLLVLFGIFPLLYLRSPKQPRLAWSYLRGLVLTLVSIAVLSPFVWLVAAAFKDSSVMNEYTFFPPLEKWSTETLNLKNFRRLFAGEMSVKGMVYYWQYLLNSTMYTTVSTVLQLFFSSLSGYALSKYDFRGKRALMAFMIGSTMIPGVLLLAPVYKMFVDFALIDSVPGLLLTGAVSAYGIFLFRQAILSVPNEIIDAGRIDGCSEFGIYLRLVMPLVKPMSAAFCMFVFLAQWNAFFAPNIFLQSQNNLTAPIVIRTYISIYQSEYGVFLAGTLLAIIPPAILFFALQKEFVSGLSSGAVKG
ncbi:MAG TPA: carbohydrate ABC transporter permease [Polyangiaceae bacterium]|jgi:ABC-type glycerol-3-phosphate transport system permease component|nr:carbohydrate ABC transporter permease [Polyangiaceae bacterium]